jgi:regulation of enolase protein 1 (concanavalin A-like superfamily)
MGCVKSISHSAFPRQSEYVTAPVKVCFHYDSTHHIGGIIVRDDREDPWVTIIRLDDGRLVLATECQYSVPEKQNA